MQASCSQPYPCVKEMMPNSIHNPHSLDNGFVAGALLKADGVSHLLPKVHIHLLSHTPGNRHGCHTTRLRAGDKLALLRIASLCNELGDLCGLAGAGLAHQDGGLVGVDLCDEFVLGLPDRQTWM